MKNTLLKAALLFALLLLFTPLSIFQPRFWVIIALCAIYDFIQEIYEDLKKQQ